MIFGKHRKMGLRRQDSKARVKAWRNVLVGTNVIVLLAAVAYLPLRHSGLLERWMASPPPTPARQTEPLPSLKAQNTAGASAATTTQFPAAPVPKQKEDPSAPGLIQAAVAALMQGSLDSAERLVDEVLAATVLDNERAEALNVRGRVCARRHDEPGAVAAHLAAIAAWPAEPRSYILLSDSLRRMGHASAAAAFLEEGTKRCGPGPIFDLKHKLARLEMGDSDKVVQEIRVMITSGELPMHLAFVQAVILYRTGNRNEALELIEKIRNQTPAADWAFLMEDPATPTVWQQMTAVTR